MYSWTTLPAEGMEEVFLQPKGSPPPPSGARP